MKFIIALALSTTLFAQPNFEDPGANTLVNPNELEKFNDNLAKLRTQLKAKYATAWEKKDDDVLLSEIRALKKEIRSLEDEWRSFAKGDTEEGYALWDQGESSISNLVMEYGSPDFLYAIPPELTNMKISIFSAIPIPRESWDEMIEIILSANGIGVKRLNAYVKQLYILKHDLSKIEAVCTKLKDLELTPGHARVFYIFSPEPDQVKGVQDFFDKFSDPKETTVQAVGHKIVLVASKASIERLISLYDAVWEKDSKKTVKVVNLKKINVEEAEKVLKAFFPDQNVKMRGPLHSQLLDELSILPLPQGLVLVGDSKAIEKAQEILFDLEKQLDDPTEMTIYWYNCKHSDPLDISAILEQVYDSLIHTDNEKQKSQHLPIDAKLDPKKPPGSSPLPVSPAPIIPGRDKSKDPKKKPLEGNFIVDLKTGSILMVIRKDQLEKIKTLLKKIDIPKKMVQIDVLLVEKKIHDRSQSGINLLKLGSSIQKSETSLSFDSTTRKGILDFIFARSSKSGLGVDLNYSFLMSQNDIRINSNPQVLAINQTPAEISIVEEISINNGAVILDATTEPKAEKSFTRAQYGTILKMTPIIHLSDEDNESSQGFITLTTDITFDTTEASENDRPSVTRRGIKNEVTVADGETIILGGLRRKNTEEKQEKIPFLGELPGIGKLFGTTSKTDNSTEMFIFITPRIIKNPIEDLRKVRLDDLQKRAGDIPEFLNRIEQAKQKEKAMLFQSSLKLLFD